MRRAAGFTLLEVLVALAIFSFVAIAAAATTHNADYMAASGKRARELRMLAERRLGEVLAFEQHYDDLAPPDDCSDWSEYGDRFKDWKWQLDIRDVTVFGISTDENAQYLFGPPSDDEKAQAAQPAGGASGAAGQPGAPAQKGETQGLRELTLRVTAPVDEGAGDSVELIVFAPQVGKKTAAAGTTPK